MRVNGLTWAKRLGMEEFEVKPGMLVVHLMAEATDLRVGKPASRRGAQGRG